MSNEELYKKVLELERKVQELSKKESLPMLNRSYTFVGDSSQDLVLKCRGKIKIQWGNKFIDLLKNDKLNVETDVIFKVSDKDSIGYNSGIYITDNLEVYLKLKGEDPISITGESGTTYVSFLEELETKSDDKHLALTNIGFLYPNMESITESSLKNGIIYIESELKLYHVKNGELSEFKIELPNPFTEQFVISKNNQSKGSLYIIGKGIENSIAFDSLYIYTTENKSIFDSKLPFQLNIEDKTILDITTLETIFKNKVISNTFQSSNYSSTSGFKLYTINGESILEVDKIIERNNSESFPSLYPELYLSKVNFIKEINEDYMSFWYEHQYEVGDRLEFFIKSDSEEDIIKLIPIEIEVIEIEENEIVFKTDYSELDNFNISNTLIFCINHKGSIKIKENIDIITDTINSRYGNIEELQLKRSDDSIITGQGIYSKVGAFDEIQYTKNYNLPLEDNSSKLISSEWLSSKIWGDYD